MLQPGVKCLPNYGIQGLNRREVLCGRVRRIEKLLSTSLSDPEVRLCVSLGLRVTERSA
jgi:hypothetical protein